MESIKYAIAKQELVQEKFDEKKIMYFLSKIPKGDRCPPVIKKKEAPQMECFFVVQGNEPKTNPILFFQQHRAFGVVIPI